MTCVWQKPDRPFILRRHISGRIQVGDFSIAGKVVKPRNRPHGVCAGAVREIFARLVRFNLSSGKLPVRCARDEQSQLPSRWLFMAIAEDAKSGNNTSGRG